MSETTTSPLTPEERKAVYKKSLNLPKTSFAMRANLGQNEPQSQKRWRKIDLYPRLLEARADSPVFAFHDGPPYANGAIHVGHLLNKTLKDLVVRSRSMTGQLCHFVPGWDCHGLPIEHRVLSELIESGKFDKLRGLDEATRRMAVRRECSRYARKFQKLQSRQMERLSILADYEEPYLTLEPAYESSVLQVFADLVDQELVYRDLKPVHWSIANQTALAEAELEYEEREDPAVYVAFEAAEREKLAAAFGLELDADPGFLIWTTTPWTLPANLLIAVHERHEYSLVSADGRLLILASELVERVTSEAGSGKVEELGRAAGAKLVGLEYRHPFCERHGRVVAADYVTLEDGTGLVHTAPGHGQEDYQTGLAAGVEIYCPVRGDGTYDESVPEWLRGLSVWEANPKIVESLRSSGHLFHDQPYVHSYPHDWRSKTPVIFRATEQWFIGVDAPMRRDGRSLRERALEATEKEVRFFPGWGRNRLRGMIESRPDWCISRQRSWGLPIPAFRRPDGSIFLTSASVRAVAEVFAQKGSDAWWTSPPEELLAFYDPTADPEAPEGLDTSGLEKMFDIFDVWFESGSSWNAVMRRRGLGFPIELYLEGSDQHRGWFQLSLLPSLGVTGKPPFKALLTHGFTLDKEGRKMSKSAGNAIEVDELLKRYGVDVCRWWVSSLAFENDIKVDYDYFDVASESYRKVRNTLRFLLSNLHDFDPSQAVDARELAPTSIDARALENAAELRRQVLEAWEHYEFRKASQLLYDFCNETLSSFYLDAVKDRLYCDRADAPRRKATQSVLFQIADLLIKLLAPILPHTADEAYRALLGDDGPCVHLETVPELEANADPAWPHVLTVREEVLKALEAAKERGIENRLDAGVVVPDPRGLLRKFEADLTDVFGVSRVTLSAKIEKIEIVDLRAKPRCERSWRRDETVKERADGGWLSDRDAEAVGLA